MRTTDIVIRLHNNLDEMNIEIGNTNHYTELHQQVLKAINSHSADIVYKGDYFRYDLHLLPEDTKEFNTYILFRDITLNDTENNELVWKALSAEASGLNYPEIREKNTKHQLIEMSVLDADMPVGDFSGSDPSLIEEILVRIPGTREELEFDGLNPEANNILYNKLAKLIYDKEAEVMYKGPRLDFEDNRDLFISPDDFSMYVLFSANRDYHYENKEELWQNLTDDLKERSVITLYKSAKNYQVIRIDHTQAAI